MLSVGNTLIKDTRLNIWEARCYRETVEDMRRLKKGYGWMECYRTAGQRHTSKEGTNCSATAWAVEDAQRHSIVDGALLYRRSKTHIRIMYSFHEAPIESFVVSAGSIAALGYQLLLAQFAKHSFWGASNADQGHPKVMPAL